MFTQKVVRQIKPEDTLYNKHVKIDSSASFITVSGILRLLLLYMLRLDHFIYVDTTIGPRCMGATSGGGG